MHALRLSSLRLRQLRSQRPARVVGSLFCALSCTLAGCSSQPVIPEAKNITLARENPSKRCVEMGRVEGTVITNRGSIEEAIENMKLDAARKGANYVRMESTGAMGTSVSGTAFQCP